MVVKEKKGRKRYIVFNVEATQEIAMKDLIYAVRQATKKMGSGDEAFQEIKPWLITFEQNVGILQCAHTSKQRAIAMLTSINRVGRDSKPVKITTILTSGTIRAAREKFTKKQSEKKTEKKIEKGRKNDSDCDEH